MDYFPLFLDLQQQPCLIVGGGDIALRKARLLLAAGAALELVAPTLNAELQALHESGKLVWHAGVYTPDQLARNWRLIISATDDAAVNAAVFRDAEAAGILVNSVDDPQHSRFITPAIIDRSPLMVALSTGGGVPVLARQLRAQLEALIPHGYGDLARLASELRPLAKEKLPDPAARRHFWEHILSGPLPDRVFAGEVTAVREEITTALRQADSSTLKRGAVYLVGSGPGNPDLLTFRALRLMQQADVVLYDNLVSADIMELVRRDAERIYVGKKSNNHALPQDEINQLLVKLAQQGQKVLRLKGGDPFIFGRGGEEIAELAAAGIDFEVVPGITSAAGASCYAGIPLTHRDFAQSVTFVTGHRRDGEIELDWPRLVNPSETVVVYMGVAQAPTICAKLIEHGRAVDTPTAIVANATRADQQVVISTLGSLPDDLAQAGIKPPALIIIGDVVKLHATLNWRHTQ
ncbi:siroheme synthase CysG [Chitinilyticum piscinae]|uniref:Siroheme synthase n=1 Tax=Chitinilyticum piscinae TaxID=2866724 RepID=A0A8J7K1F2_9NEIS|nr:siroheme synthase CysG [Chitinilyticum piscinae]MBE9608602.1 uroporphyrinogen-III C-methyltransferase [Chitinilyticum piscinae]